MPAENIDYTYVVEITHDENNHTVTFVPVAKYQSPLDAALAVQLKNVQRNEAAQLENLIRNEAERINKFYCTMHNQDDAASYEDMFEGCRFIVNWVEI